MEMVIGLVAVIWENLNDNAALMAAIIAFWLTARVGKKAQTENERYIGQIWDEIYLKDKSTEQAVLWLLVLNTEKIERQATHLRGIYAAALAILVFLAFQSL